MSNRSRVLLKGIASGFLGRGVSLITPLLVMGPMLDYVGDELFGTWLTAVSLSTMATFLGSGVNNALLTRLSDAFGHDDLPRARVLLGQGYVLSSLISIGSLSIISLIGLIVFSFLNAGTDPVTEAKIIILAVDFSALFLSFPSQILGRMLQAEKKFFRSQIFQSTGSLVALAMALLSIKFGHDPVFVIALFALMPILTQFVWSAVYFKIHVKIRPIFCTKETDHWLSLFRLGGNFFIVSILVTVSMNIDNTLVALWKGTETVAEFGVPMRLGSILMLVVLIFFYPLWSMFGDALAKKDSDWVVSTSRMFGIGVAAFVLFLGAGMVLYSEDIMKLWVGRTFENQGRVLAGAIALAIVVAYTSPHNMLLNAAGKARQQILAWGLFLSTSITLKCLALSFGTPV